MKKGLIIALSSIGAIGLAFGITISAAAIYSANYKIPEQEEKITNTTGLVQAKNRSLYDVNGDKIILEGVNFGNIFLQEGWLSPFALEPLKNNDGSYKKDKDGNIEYPEFAEEDFRNGLLSNPNCGEENFDTWFNYFFNCWVNESDYKLLKELNLNAIRLPIYWRNLLNDDFSRKDETTAFKYIDKIISDAKDNDLYIILDLHGVPGSQNGFEHSGVSNKKVEFWHNETYINAAIDCWKFISEHYSTTRNDLSSTIATYDILNEPTYRYRGSTTRPCWNVFDRIYDAIRELNDNHVITMEGGWSFNALPNPEEYGWTNVQYEYHLYNYGKDIITYDFLYLYHELNNMIRDYNVPTYIGEFTFFEDKAEWYRGFEIFKERNYSWTVWNFKGCTVGWWTTSWAVLTSKLHMNHDTEETKPNVSKCTFDEFKYICDKTVSEKCETSTLYEVIKNRNIK